MSTTFSVQIGDRGRLVVPAELRQSQSWAEGTPILLIETEHGVVMTSRERAKELIRAQLSGASLVEELISERRIRAAQEDSA
ncbi:MAG: AbrB/MazE/SpoVT family DNA-binding domain-containing protein [Leucobacter sp.]